jgi:hypothetical protein
LAICHLPSAIGYWLLAIGSDGASLVTGYPQAIPSAALLSSPEVPFARQWNDRRPQSRRPRFGGLVRGIATCGRPSSPGFFPPCTRPSRFVEVGSPVARRPPHRSRRAVFPHRALQPDTLSIARRKVCQFSSVVLTELVACVDFVRLSAPSAISGPTPCHDLLRADPTPQTASAASPCR